MHSAKQAKVAGQWGEDALGVFAALANSNSFVFCTCTGGPSLNRARTLSLQRVKQYTDRDCKDTLQCVLRRLQRCARLVDAIHEQLQAAGIALPAVEDSVAVVSQRTGTCVVFGCLCIEISSRCDCLLKCREPPRMATESLQKRLQSLPARTEHLHDLTTSSPGARKRGEVIAYVLFFHLSSTLVHVVTLPGACTVALIRKCVHGQGGFRGRTITGNLSVDRRDK
jgi:hypothetical protein